MRETTLKKKQEINHLPINTKEPHKHNTTSNNKNNRNQLSLVFNISQHQGTQFIKKRHRLTDWICKQDPAICCIQETHLSDKGRHYLRVKGWKTIFQANGPKKQAGVAILILNKSNFQPKVIKKDKEGHFIHMKGKTSKRNSQY